MTSLTKRIEQAVRKYVLAVMPRDPSGELPKQDLADLLMTFGNWRRRFVHAHPRAVQLSRELAANPSRALHQDALDAITRAVEAGEDLTPYLSRRVGKAYVPSGERPAALKRRQDLDLLLSDWDVHHLHLNTEIEDDGFVKRSGDLLFAVFHHEDAYFINLYPHLEWTQLSVIETIVRNWPDAGIVLGTISNMSLTHQHTDEERKELREGGVASILEVDGRVVMPGGITTAGTSLKVTQQVNTIMHSLYRWRQSPGSLLAEVEQKVHVAGFVMPTGRWFPFVQDDTCWLGSGKARVPLFDLVR